MGKKALGKGIDALFGDVAEQGTENIVIEIPLNDIDPNRDQPRKRFDTQELNNLADSMRAVGVIQPITVYADGDRYTIIAGERRWRAARIAELRTIPALVKDMDKVRRMELALIENLQREDLNPIEEALGIRQLMEECGLTQEAVGKRLGRSRPAVANLLRLLTLSDDVLELVREGRLSEGHARAIASLDDSGMQKELAMRVISNGMNVRQVEQAVKRILQTGMDLEAPAVPASSDESLQIVKDAARQAFGTKVAIQGDSNKGVIMIHYYSRDDLERIYARVASKEA